MCDKGHCPPGLGFCFFKKCLKFVGSPPFSFSFPLLRFFDGLLVRWWLRVILKNFSYVFMRMSHLSISGPFGMVFDNLQDVFDPKGFANNFIQFHHLSSHVAMGHFLGSIAWSLGATMFLVLAKPLDGIKLIAIGEVLIGWLAKPYVLSFEMGFLFNYCFICLVW